MRLFFFHHLDLICVATELPSVISRNLHDVMPSQITSLTIVYSTVFFRRRSKKISKPRVTGLFARNSTVTGKFEEQRASKAEIVPI